MIGKFKRTSKHKQQWHSWFAWYPVRVESHNGMKFRWVWLEKIERKVDLNWASSTINYRLV